MFQEQYDELLSIVEDARRAYTKLVAEFEGETRRLEEAARSGLSSSSGESSAVSSRKTSKTDSETDSAKSDRKISGASDEGDWMTGPSQLSVAAPEFHPVSYQGVPPPWPSYHPSPYEYPHMMPLAPPQYFLPHPPSYVASPPHMQYDGFLLSSPSHQFQGQVMAWRDPRDQRQGTEKGNKQVSSPVGNETVPESRDGVEKKEEFADGEGIAALLCDGRDIESQDDVLVDSDGVIDEEDEEEMEQPIGSLESEGEEADGEVESLEVGDGKQEVGMAVGGEGTENTERQAQRGQSDGRQQVETRDGEEEVKEEGNGEDVRTCLRSDEVGTEGSE